MSDLRSEPPPQPPSRAGWVPVVVVLAVALGLIGAVALARTWLSPGSGTSGTPATVTAGDVPSVAAHPALIEAAVAQPEWTAVVRELLAYDDWLRIHPSAAGLAKLMDPTNPDYATMAADINRLVTGEVHYDPLPGPIRLEGVTLVNHNGTTADVQVRFTAPRLRAVDSKGEVVVDKPERVAAPIWHLRYSDGQWRILGTSAP
jgi:hypothetical protein